MGWVGVEVDWVSQNMDSWQQREEQRGKAKESSGGHRRSVTVESIGDTGMVGWGAERKRAGVEGGGGGGEGAKIAKSGGFGGRRA